MTDPNGEFRFDFQINKPVQQPDGTADDGQTPPASLQFPSAAPVAPGSGAGATQAMPQTPADSPASAMGTVPMRTVPVPPARSAAMPADDPQATQAFDPLAAFDEPAAPSAPVAGTPAAAVPAAPGVAGAPTESYDPFGQPTVQSVPSLQSVQQAPTVPMTTSAAPADQPTVAMGQPTVAQPTVAMNVPQPTVAMGQPTAAMPPQPTVAMGVAEQGVPQDEQATQVFQPLTPMTPQPGLAGTGVPPTIPPFGDADDDAENDGAGDGGKPKKPVNKGKVAGIVIAVIVVIALIVGGVLWFRSNDSKLAVESCTRSQQAWQTASKALTDKVNEAKQLAESASGKVADAGAISSLNSAINAANNITVDDAVTCPADGAADGLKTSAQTFDTATRRAREQTRTINSAIKNVNGSMKDKAANDLKADLKNTITTAQNLLNSSAGQVQDDATRTALQDAITNANTVASQSRPSQADVGNAKSQIEKAVADVNASMQAKQEADAAAEAQRQAEEEARRQAELEQQQQEDEQNQQDQQQDNEGDTDSGTATQPTE